MTKVRGVLVAGALAITRAEDTRTFAKLAISAVVILAGAAVLGTAVRIFLVTAGFGGG